MERRGIGSVWEKLVEADLNNIGLYGQASFDTVVGKVLIPDIAYEGFSVVQSGLAEVTVGNGHFMYTGAVYVNDQVGGITLDLAPRLPVSTKRIVTIVAVGTEFDTETVNRTFLTDADTRTTIALPVPVVHVRWADIGMVSGMENRNPLPPAVAANVCPIAYVLLSTDGIESITVADAFVTPSLREVDSRLNEYDLWKKVIGTRIDTLAADLLELASKIFGLSPFSFVLRVAYDVVRLKLLYTLPQTYVDWAADNFMGEQYSQTDDADYLATVEEGLKPAPASMSDSQLGLLDINDPSVINTNYVILPYWTSVVRIQNMGSDAKLPLNRYTYGTVPTTQLTMTRARYRYGPQFVVTQNQLSQFLHIGGYGNGQSNPAGVWDPIENVYRMNNGEEFAVVGLTPGLSTTQSWNFDTVTVNGTEVAIHDRPNTWVVSSPGTIRLAQRFTDYYEEPYWPVITISGSVAGVAIAQSFLNSQDGWVHGVDFFFSDVAVVGDVTCLLCECTNGAPDFSRIIARTTVAVADLKVSPAATGVTLPTDGSPPNVSGMIPTRFDFDPTFISQGRYAFILVSAGAHSLWELVDTNYISGTLFYSTDGDWSLGDLAHDLAFRVHFCKFAENMVKVNMLALELSGGIAAIDILAQTIIPTSTHLFYEIQVDGVWISLEDLNTTPAVVLADLPETLPLRACFVGSESVHACLGVAANSRSRCYRPRNDFTHISTVRTFDSPCTTVTVRCVLDNWLGGPHHSFTAKLLHGVDYLTSRSPDTTSVEVNPDNPDTSVIYSFTWNGMGAISSCRFRLEGTTDNLLTPFVVSERIDIDIA